MATVGDGEARDVDRLLADVQYYQKCCQLFENYRKCLLFFDQNCICGQNNGFEFVVEALERQYEALMRADMNVRHDSCRRRTQPQLNGSQSSAASLVDDGYYGLLLRNEQLLRDVMRGADNEDSDSDVFDDTDDDDTGEYNSPTDGTDGELFDEDFICDKSAKNQKLFQNYTHVNRKYGCRRGTGDKAAKKRFACDWPACDKSFKDNSALQAHVRCRHTNERPFKCPDCDKCFADKKHLTEHRKQHLETDRHRCLWPGCPFESSKEWNLKAHIKRIHQKSERQKSFKCDYIGCDKCYYSNSELKFHKKTFHSNERPFACDWPGCEATYKTKQKVVEHKAVHMNCRQYRCEYNGCQKSFNTQKRLGAHRNEVHIKPYACSWPACGQSFGSNRSLKTHMNAHQDIRPLSCGYRGCEKGFFSRPQLNQHLKASHKYDLNAF